MFEGSFLVLCLLCGHRCNVDCSVLLVIKSKYQVMGMKDFDPAHKALEGLDLKISDLLDEFKSSLKGRRDTTACLLKQAIDKLSSIKAVMQQTSRANEELNDIKESVHEQVEVYIKSVNENSGNDEQADKNMIEAMHGIKTEAERFKTIVENLKNLMLEEIEGSSPSLLDFGDLEGKLEDESRV